MTRAWWRTHWQGLLIGVTAVLVAPSVGIGLYVAATGAATNRTVTLQQESQARAECITSWTGEFNAAIGRIVIVAARDRVPSDAQVERLVEAVTVDRNAVCDPDRPGGVLLP